MIKPKNIKTIIISIALLVFIFSWQRASANSTSSGNSSGLINNATLSEKFQEIKEKPWATSGGEGISKIKNWFFARKDAIKQGLAEEKEEFKGGLRKIINDAWSRIKDLIKIKEFIKKLWPRGDRGVDD